MWGQVTEKKKEIKKGNRQVSPHCWPLGQCEAHNVWHKLGGWQRLKRKRTGERFFWSRDVKEPEIASFFFLNLCLQRCWFTGPIYISVAQWMHFVHQPAGFREAINICLASHGPHTQKKENTGPWMPRQNIIAVAEGVEHNYWPPQFLLYFY